SFVNLAVEGVIQLALSKFPNERHQSARELVDAFGAAIGQQNLWDTTRPAGYDAMRRTATVHYTPPPRSAPRLPPEPFRVSFSYDVTMPERMAAVKIKGFVDDFSGVVLDSNPGVIQIRLGVPDGYDAQKPEQGSSIFKWFKAIRKPSIQTGQEPI